MQQWHLDVQHELPDHTVVTVSYVGSKGTHARPSTRPEPIVSRSRRRTIRISQARRSVDADCEHVSPNIGDPNVSGVVNGNTITRAGCHQSADCLRQRCQSVSAVLRHCRPSPGLENKASSIYHALQVSARKSVGALSLTVAYTYSHSIDDSSDRYDGSISSTRTTLRMRAAPVPTLTSATC